MIFLNNYKIKLFIFIAFFLGFTAVMFYNPSVLSDGVKNGIDMCTKTIIPSLFPFMVVSDFIILSGVGSAVGEKLSALTKVFFNLPGCTSCVVLMSLTGGFPVGARMTAKLAEEKYISQSQGRRMLLFCVNCGPAFSVSTVGTAMLSSKKAGIVIYVSLILSSLIVGIISRFFEKDNCNTSIKTVSDINGGVISDSVKDSTAAILSICAWVILFSCIGNCMSMISIPEKIKAVLFSILEVTNGCQKSSKLFAPFFLAGIIGWSGIAVHCQIAEYLKKCKMSYFVFLLGRIATSLLSTIICFLLMKLFRIDIDVFSSASDVAIKPFSISFSSAVAVVILAVFMLADNSLARNKRI